MSAEQFYRSGRQDLDGGSVKAMKNITRLKFAVAALSLALASCDAHRANSIGEGLSLPSFAGFNEPKSTLETKFHASDEDVARGFAALAEGNYGLAQQHLQAGVEKSPNDLAAWVGLAASYDRLRRFDLADRAYSQAIRLGGVNATILNNQGYSYLLRGDLPKARSSFLAAQTLDPQSPTIANNLRLLDGSRRYVRRVAAAS